jgi:non-ribosomal peptide synthetase component F
VLARCLGDPAPLPAAGWQYRQFARWQADLLASERARGLRDYWLGQLSGMSLARIPLASRGADLEGRRCSEQVQIDPAVVDELRGLARSHQTTLFTVMFSVFVALLACVTGQSDLAVGSMFANRTEPQAQGTVGFLANLVVLRVKLPANPVFDDVIMAAHDTVAGALAHQDLPYHLLPQARAASPSVRVDDVVFQMLAEPIDRVTRTGDLELAGVVPDVVGRFDVEFALMVKEDGCAAKLYFTRSRLDPAWARHFITSYAALAGAVADDPARPIRALAPLA